MTYATTSELVIMTGSQLDTVTLQGLLDEADRQINTRISEAGGTAPASDDSLKSACLCLGNSLLLNRIRTDGRNVSEPQYQWEQDEVNRAIQQQQTLAWSFVDTYIKTAATNRHRWYFRKVNS